VLADQPVAQRVADRVVRLKPLGFNQHPLGSCGCPDSPDDARKIGGHIPEGVMVYQMDGLNLLARLR